MQEQDLLPCIFDVGDIVTWVEGTPASWKFIYTPGPMVVKSIAYYQTGEPSEYALRFDPKGMDLKPGWIIEVEFLADDSKYYDPPRSLLFRTPTLTHLIHEMWLVTVPDPAAEALWNELAPKLRKRLGLAPLTPEEEKKTYDEAPYVEITEEEAQRIVQNMLRYDPNAPPTE